LPRFGGAKLWINIDHHPSNPRYGDLVYIDPTAPATGQILYEFLKNQKFPITPCNCGKSLRRDFNRYRFVSVSEYDVRTFQIAAELVECGVDVGRVSQLLYESFPRRRIELLRELLGTMHFGCDGKLAWFSLSQRAALALACSSRGQRGVDRPFARHGGVVVAIFFRRN
jgi:phosphoesterase RecJ-like protein